MDITEIGEILELVVPLRTRQHLLVSAGIGEDEKTRFHELLLDLIGECARGEATSERLHEKGPWLQHPRTDRWRPCLRAGVLRVLENSSLPVGTGGDHANILRVLNGDNDPSGKHEFVPGLRQVDEENSWHGEISPPRASAWRFYRRCGASRHIGSSGSRNSWCQDARMQRASW